MNKIKSKPRRRNFYVNFINKYTASKSFIAVNITFIIVSVLFMCCGYYLITYSNELDENLDGRNYYVDLNISNKTDKLNIYDFNYIYDFSTNKGSIIFKTLPNNTASDIEIRFIPGILNNSIEVNCGENIDNDDFNYNIIGTLGRLHINTTDIWSNSPFIYYSINFSSNWTPKGTFKFVNVNKNTEIDSSRVIHPNVELILKDKYKSDLYIPYFYKLETTDYSEDNHVQAKFPDNVTGFSGSVKLSAIDKEVLYEKTNKFSFGISILVASFFFLLSILYNICNKRYR